MLTVLLLIATTTIGSILGALSIGINAVFVAARQSRRAAHSDDADTVLAPASRAD